VKLGLLENLSHMRLHAYCIGNALIVIPVQKQTLWQQQVQGKQEQVQALNMPGYRADSL